jgi:hypothetical protein
MGWVLNVVPHYSLNGFVGRSAAKDVAGMVINQEFGFNQSGQ